MQSDIVQRLLGRARFLRDAKNRIKSPELMEEAAAEITRLTEALRAAEEREKALREAGYALLQLIGPDNSRVYANDPQVIAFRQAITGAKP